MSDSKRKPFLLRVSDALRALSASGEGTRSIMPVTYPNFPAGTQQMQLIRTADPSEYRRDGRTVRVQGFNAHPVVHACIRVVADIIASVPLVVLKEKGDYESRVGDDHPLQKLLDYPGPRFTARQFRARFAVDFLGYGNSFFVMERPGENRPPIALRPVNPESVQQVWIDTEGDPRRYDFANWAGIIVNVLTEDMLHFRDLEMGRPFEADVFGYPRGATAIGSLLADNEATNYVRQVVTNDGTPTFAVLMADEATTEDAVAMQDRYSARVVERGKRGVPAFFGAVKDIKPLGFTLSDLEFPDLRRVAREDICAAFGVDPRMIGIASASSDAGLSGIQYAEARARLVQHTIEPLFSAFEDELNHWLAPEFGDVWVTYNHDILRDLVENDTETSTRIRAEYSEGLRTWEESRRAIKLSPLPEPTDSILKVVGRDLIPAAIAVIDPSLVLDEPPETDNETPDMAPNAVNALPPSSTAVGSADVQGTALNGAQVTSLVSMLTQLATGQLPDDTVEALIKAAFPAVSDELVAQMLSGMKGFTPTTPIEPVPVRRVSRLSVRAFAEDALNGEQVEALMELLEELIDKELPRDTVEALIQAAFPKMDRDLITAMLDGLDGFDAPLEEEEVEEQGRAKPDELSKGDFCSWTSSGGTARGRIERIERDGTINVPNSSFSIEGTEDDPAALIRVYQESKEGWAPSDTLVGHKFSTLRKIEPLRKDSRAEAVTNFPENGNDKKVSLRNSQYALFPVGEAEDLKENFPEIWRKGGNIKGNEQFAKLAPIAKRGGVPDGEAEENAVRLREAWVARHRGDFQLAGVVAQIKWLAVGDRGLNHMRATIREAKEKLKDRSDTRSDERTAMRRAYWDRAMHELDRTEMQYKATAKAQFSREKKRVTDAIRTAQNPSAAETRVRQMYRTNGEFEDDWRTAFEPLVTKTYESGAKQVAGPDASLSVVLNDKTIRADGVDLPMGANKKKLAEAAQKLAAPELKASALAAIKARTTRLSELIGDTTAKEVLAAIRAGEQGALSVEEISRLVGRAVYGEDRIDARTDAIARTEAAGAMSQGSWDQAQAEGELFRSKTWLSFSDNETRETHLALNETTIDINDPFITLGGDVLMYPLDPDAVAGEVINCRCVLTYSDEPV